MNKTIKKEETYESPSVAVYHVTVHQCIATSTNPVVIDPEEEL